MDLLAAARLRVVTLAPHRMEIFQLLDLSFLAIFKREGRCQLPFDRRTTTIIFV
jgi:hypothetical protein